jgi:hypothetical protein
MVGQHLLERVRRQRRPHAQDDDYAGRVRGDLSADLPDEDFGEDLSDALDLYRMGSKPRCEEVEYLTLTEEAIERMAWGRED